jgi:hypothetical protein
MGYRQELADISRYRNAYGLAASAAMGSIFYGWDIGRDTNSFGRVSLSNELIFRNHWRDIKFALVPAILWTG